MKPNGGGSPAPEMSRLVCPLPVTSAKAIVAGEVPVAESTGATTTFDPTHVVPAKGRTVTLNEQVAVFPAWSLAVRVTGVVQSGKAEPGGWVAFTTTPALVLIRTETSLEK